MCLIQVFPRGSPLLPDISRAILNVTEGGKTKEIEKKWFGEVTSHQDSTSQVSSNSLGLESFWGLFLIAGVASFSALIIFAAMFLYQQRKIIIGSDTADSKWEKIREILRIYDHKDLNSHTFKKNAESEEGRRGGDNIVVDGAHEGSPGTNFHPSPSTYSIHTDQSDLGFLGEQETPPREFGNTPQEATSGIELSFVVYQQTPFTTREIHGSSF